MKHIGRAAMARISDRLSWVDRYFCEAGGCHPVPIIVTGPARSGTTLLYQSLASGLGVSYTPRFLDSFPGAPVLGALAYRWFVRKRENVEYCSQYGKEEGAAGLSQCHSIWGRWFDVNCPGVLLEEQRSLEFRRVLWGLEAQLGRPLALKWPGFVAHLEALNQALPSAFFVFTDRDTFPLARSIAKGRLDLKGSLDFGISRSPSGYHLHEVEDGVKDVVRYIRDVRGEVARFCQSIDDRRFCHVRYEDLCGGPYGVVDNIAAMYNDWSNADLQLSNRLPVGFNCSPGPDLGELGNRIWSEIVSSESESTSGGVGSREGA
ncbi:sulfotransferase [Thioalkalivibrio sp. ALJ15]|uniref:sulfotransferase n=1 Tax=Thioalkalivibrio sp. ALJ15 TaxID=748652 RepID=UPI000A056DB0|nr:sulfotransferase [Thioalkalivibrio sp. ALJ15]